MDEYNGIRNKWGNGWTNEVVSKSDQNIDFVDDLLE